MRTGAIIQARMSSTRLPGKVLLPILGRPMLARQIERVQRSTADEVIVATTESPSDDGVVAVAEEAGAVVYRGPMDDVLARYLGAAHQFGIDVIARLTADCPLIEPAAIDAMFWRHAKGDADHVDVLGIPDGTGGQCFSTGFLEELDEQPDITADDREHVTLYARRRTDRYRIVHVQTGFGMDAEPWSVDTYQDYLFVCRIFELLYPRNPAFDFNDILRLWSARPELREINRRPMGRHDAELIQAYTSAIREFAPVMGDL